MSGNHRSDLEERALVGLETAILVGIGGFAGANLRYFVGTLVPGLAGTLVVNATGSFVLGLVLYEALYTGLLARETRVVVATGFLSSFTTYSTFALETAQAPEWALLNVVGSYALGFGGVLVGRSIARRLKEGA